jgi:NADPH:quinone reductase-like Zn-dependent oxidoreductase
MRAVVCKAFGPPEKLVVEDLPSPALGKGEARIEFKRPERKVKGKVVLVTRKP